MYELISFVKRGKIRRVVIENLSRPKTPTELSDLINAHRSSVSRAIIALEKKELIKCLTPSEKRGRLYKITALGEKILKEF